MRAATVGKTADSAATTIHEKCHGGPSWCVGITSDPRRRLAAGHLVDLSSEAYCWIECETEQIARGAEDILHERYGYQVCDDSPTMVEGSLFVYAYRISADTTQGL